MDTLERTQQAQAALADLETQAQAKAAELATLRNEITAKQSALGALELDNPEAADTPTAELQKLKAKAERLQSAQVELARRLVEAQAELQAARFEDGKQKFAELNANLEGSTLFAKLADALADATQATAWKKEADALRREFGPGVGAWSGSATEAANLAEALFHTQEPLLNYLTALPARSPVQQQMKAAIWERLYGEQARRNIAYAVEHYARLDTEQEAAQRFAAERQEANARAKAAVVQLGP